MTSKPTGVHPCAFCLSKHTVFCDECAERYQMVILLEDDSEIFLTERDMALQSPSSYFPPAH